MGIEDILHEVGHNYPPGWSLQDNIIYDPWGPRDIVASSANDEYCQRLAWRIYLDDLTGCGDKKRLITQCFNKIKAEWPEAIKELEQMRQQLSEMVDEFAYDKWQEYTHV